MRINVEIEFKTFITKEKYEELLSSLKQTDNILVQTNHYFDSKNDDLESQKKVLRIRQKTDQYKLTKKSKGDVGNIENHLYLTPEEAKNMLENGFDASIIGENLFVYKVGELTTYRSKLEYKSGFVFLDKSVYNGITDYELEFEAPDKEKGTIEFNEILKEFNIEYTPSSSKFKRCMSTKKASQN